MAALSIIQRHVGTPVSPGGRWSRLSQGRDCWGLMHADSRWQQTDDVLPPSAVSTDHRLLPVTAEFTSSCLLAHHHLQNLISHFILSVRINLFPADIKNKEDGADCPQRFSGLWFLSNDWRQQPALGRASSLALSLHRSLRKRFSHDGPVSLSQNPSLTFAQTPGVSRPAGEGSGRTESPAGQKEEEGTENSSCYFYFYIQTHHSSSQKCCWSTSSKEITEFSYLISFHVSYLTQHNVE